MLFDWFYSRFCCMCFCCLLVYSLGLDNFALVWFFDVPFDECDNLFFNNDLISLVGLISLVANVVEL